MGLIFNLTIIVCFILHLTSSDEFIIASDQLMSEIKTLKNQMDYLTEQMKTLKEKNLNLEKKFTNEVYQPINWLNETVERVLNWTKINSNDIDSIVQCLNISVKECNKEDNSTQPKATNQSVINQDQCKISEPSQLYHLSPDTLVYTWKNLNTSYIVKKEELVIESDIFSLDKHEMNAQLKIRITSYGILDPFMRFFKKQQSDTKPLIVHPRVTYVIKVEKNGKIIDTSVGPESFIRLGSLLKYNSYNYRNSFYYYYHDEPGLSFSMEAHVETAEMSNQFYSDNGTIKGSICPYGKIMQWSAADQIESIYSPYFYTSPQGYRAFIKFVLDNTFYANRLSLFINLSPGLNDSLFKIPKWKATFTLINQVDASKSATQVKENIGSLVLLKFSLPPNMSKFVVNDELKYEASIEILN